MKKLLKILKWTGISIGSLIVLILLTGLCFRLFNTAPQAPGKLVDVGGFNLHINSSGEKSNKPTLVIESGAGTPATAYHWLDKKLNNTIRVVRYDRAGLGYSDESNTPRDPKTVARELHTLLEKSGEHPPYIMAGHSLGGLHIRVFTQMYPDEVVGMVFLDSSHPDQQERMKMPVFDSMTTILKVYSVLADMGIVSAIDTLFGPLTTGEGLPSEINHEMSDILKNGKHLSGQIKEMEFLDTAFQQSKTTKDFGSIPVRVFTAAGEIPEINKKIMREFGMDPDTFQPKWFKLQKEIAETSTNGKQVNIDGNHFSIFTKEENADIICKEIRLLLRELGY